MGVGPMPTATAAVRKPSPIERKMSLNTEPPTREDIAALWEAIRELAAEVERLRKLVPNP